MTGFRALVVAMALVGSACGSDGADDGDTTATCDGLADRWTRLHQAYLDEVDDADLVELEEGSRRTLIAASALATAMIEQTRDADAVGCAEQVDAGSPLLCDRVPTLSPRGELGRSVVDRLSASC